MSLFFHLMKGKSVEDRSVLELILKLTFPRNRKEEEGILEIKYDNSMSCPCEPTSHASRHAVFRNWPLMLDTNTRGDFRKWNYREHAFQPFQKTSIRINFLVSSNNRYHPSPINTFFFFFWILYSFFCLKKTHYLQ